MGNVYQIVRIKKSEEIRGKKPTISLPTLSNISEDQGFYLHLISDEDKILKRIAFCKSLEEVADKFIQNSIIIGLDDDVTTTRAPVLRRSEPNFTYSSSPLTSEELEVFYTHYLRKMEKKTK